jgi:hypothetical protein
MTYLIDHNSIFSTGGQNENDDEMGKRKTRKKPQAKRKNVEALETQFNCPFCNHERSCEVKM